MELALFAATATAYVAVIGANAFSGVGGPFLSVPAAAALKVAPIALLAVRVRRGPVWSPRYQTWITLGLVLSALGDVFLALDDRFFLAGLAAFLLGHVCYSAAFWSSSTRLRVARALPVASAGGAYYVLVLRPFVPPDLAVPVAAYVAVIVVMVWRSAAAIDRAATTPARRRLAWTGLVGAVLFFVSDAVLAFNMFVQPVPLGSVATMVPYYLGQLGIALSSLP